MQLADHDETVPELTPNAYECLEHNEVFMLIAGDPWDEDETRCPYDDGHYVRPMLIAGPGEAPDGIPADVAADYFATGRDRYEFGLDPS